jgi:hypothetical protein
MIALAVARAKRREGAIDRIADFSASPPALIEIADQVDDSTASSRTVGLGHTSHGMTAAAAPKYGPSWSAKSRNKRTDIN